MNVYLPPPNLPPVATAASYLLCIMNVVCGFAIKNDFECLYSRPVIDDVDEYIAQYVVPPPSPVTPQRWFFCFLFFFGKQIGLTRNRALQMSFFYYRYYQVVW